MNKPVEKLYSKAAARRRLGISRARYEQFIESGILPAPFAIVEGSRPIHTESQIARAESNLYERALSNLRNRTPGARPVKPISEKHAAEIRAAYLRKQNKK